MTTIQVPPSPARGLSDWWQLGIVTSLLLVVQFFDPPLFHLLVELFTGMVALVVAVVGRQSYRFTRNDFVASLADGFLWVGLFRIAHSVTTDDYAILEGEHSARSFQFWLAATYLEAGAFLVASIAPFSGDGGRRSAHALRGLAALLFAAIAFGLFTSDYLVGHGAPEFSVVSGYVTVAISIAALIALRFNRRRIGRRVALWMSLALVTLALSALIFMAAPLIGEESSVVMGHAIRFAAEWIIYVGVIRTSLTEPFSSLTRSANSFDAIPDPTVVLDEHGIIRQVNRAASQFFGPAVDPVGRHCHDLLHNPLTSRGDCPVCRRVAAMEPLLCAEVELPALQQWHEVSLAQVTSGSVTGGMVHVSRDITRRKQTEAALRKSEGRLRRVIENSSEWIWELDDKGECVYVSPQVFDCLGYQPKEVIGKTLFDFMPYWESSRSAVVLEPIFERRAAFKGLEMINVHKDGRLVVLECNGFPHFDDQGRFLGYQGSSRDITERIETEGALRRSEGTYRTLVDHLRQFVYLKDSDSVFLSCNRSYARLFGRVPEDLVGRSVYELYPRDVADELCADDLRIMETGETVESDESFVVNGNEMTVHLVKTAVRDPNGKVIGVLGIFWDITEKRQAELAVLESRAQLASGELLAGLGSWRREFATGRSYWSDGMYRIYGVSPQSFEPTMENMGRFLPRESREQLERAVERLCIAQEPVEYEHELMRADGERRVVHVHATPTFDKRGDLIGVLGISLDVTERREMERALWQALDRFEGIFANIYVSIAVFDSRFNFIRVNPSFAAIYGRNPEDFTDKNLTEFLVDKEVEGVFRQVAETAIPYSVQAAPWSANCCPGPQERCFQDWTLYPIEGRNGNVETLMLTMVDVTERQLAQQALAQSELRYRAMMENASDGILVIDATGRFIDANRRAEDLLGYTEEELVRMGPYDLHAPEDRETLSVAFRDMNEKGFSRYDHLVVTKGGRVVPVEMSGTRIEFGDTHVYLSNIRDISERKRIEQELHSYRHELEKRVMERTIELHALNSELESFSYSVSHDLLAPLRSINGFSEVLREEYAPALDDTARGYLDKVQRATVRMGELIDGLLNLSRVSRAEFSTGRVNLSALGHEVARALQEGEPERCVEFRIEEGLTAHGDPTLLRVLLENVFNNAWKFTANREVGVIVFGHEYRPGQEIFFIRDNGAGFETLLAPRLFQPFERLHRSEEYQGTGIGLATVRRIVQRHGGEVWAEGEPDRGATIYFSLCPAVKAHKQA